MPLHKRIETLRADNKQALTALENQIRDDVTYQKSQREYLDKAARLAHRQAPESILRNYLAKLEDFSTFWQQHLERLNRFNTLKPLPQYKVKRAYALSQRLRYEMQIHQTLSWLHAPIREQVDAMVAQQQQGYDLTETDVHSLGQRIDTLLPLLDKLLLNSQTLLDGREQLKRLASLSQRQILEYLREALVGWELFKSPLTWRWARIEACFNRLSLLEQLDEKANTGSSVVATASTWRLPSASNWPSLAKARMKWPVAWSPALTATSGQPAGKWTTCKHAWVQAAVHRLPSSACSRIWIPVRRKCRRSSMPMPRSPCRTPSANCASKSPA